jgi:hypothetical protein
VSFCDDFEPVIIRFNTVCWHTVMYITAILTDSKGAFTPPFVRITVKFLFLIWHLGITWAIFWFNLGGTPSCKCTCSYGSCPTTPSTSTATPGSPSTATTASSSAATLQHPLQLNLHQHLQLHLHHPLQLNQQ